MDLEPTQQSTQDQNTAFTTSITESADEGAVAILTGSVGMFVRWVLVPGQSNDDSSRVWTFGRGPTASFQFDVRHKRLSNLHFRIFATRDSPPTVMLTDCSTNGTYLNDIRLQKGQNSMIVNGDVISVGHGVVEDEIKFVVTLPSERVAHAAATGVNAAYAFGKTLGQGAFAQVRLAVLRETGEKRAVKIIQKSKITQGVSVEREIDVLKALRNEFIVGLLDFYEDSNYYYLVMDYVPGGDLMDYVTEHGFIPEDASREILRQVLVAIRHVHRMGISHRDLKPDNILIAQDTPVRVKLADFGLAKISNQGTFLKTFCGTLSYLAPEVLASRNAGKVVKGGYSQLVDIWSVGCVAYVILTGYMPFNGQTQDDLYQSVQQGRYNPEPLRVAGVSPGALDFIRTLLTVDVAKRPTAEQALRHPWLQHDDVEGHTQGSGVSQGASQAISQGVSQGVPQVVPAPEPAPERQLSGVGISSLNIQSSVVHRPDALPDSDPEGHPGNQAAEFIPSSLPELARHSDSDEDSLELRHRADVAASQHAGVASGLPLTAGGIRDYDNLRGLSELDVVPEGAWLRLATQRDSKPFKDIYIAPSSLTFGRAARPGVDLVIDDTRMSSLHCRIERVRDAASGRWQVWLLDFSTNGCLVNGVHGGTNVKTQLFDGDVLYLFLERVDGGAEPRFELLAFDLELLGDRAAYEATRFRAVEFTPLAPGEVPPVLPAAAAPSVAGRKRAPASERSLSFGRPKRAAAAESSS